MPSAASRKYSGAVNFSANAAERRRHEDQREDRADAGEERADGGDAERRARAALAGELVAVDGRHDARRIRPAR